MSRLTSAYRTFVLRFWQEPQSIAQSSPWRFSLEDAETKARYGFRNVGELVNFLERQTNEGSDVVEP
jgi:hypothetical protein